MRTARTSVLAAGAVTLALLATATAAVGADGGTVGATVTVDRLGACLTVGASAVTFPTLRFSQTGQAVVGKATPAYDLANCGDAATIHARGTDAASTEGTAWGLTGDPLFVDACTQPDVFAVDVEGTGASTVVVATSLTTIDQPIAELAPDATGVTVDHDLTMPCQGSAGARETMAFDIVYTAVASEEPPVEPVAGQVVINEIRQNESAPGLQYFELHNPGTTDVDVNGLVIMTNGGNHQIANAGPLLLTAGGFLVLGGSSPLDGVTMDYVYSGTFMGPSSSNGFVQLEDFTNGSKTIDRVQWDSGATFPNPPTQRSMSLRGPTLDNAIGANWCTSFQNTPRAVNNCS